MYSCADILSFLQLSLALMQLIEIWRHSSITSEVRAQLEGHYSDTYIGKLMLCPWCLSVQAAFAVLVINELASHVLALQSLRVAGTEIDWEQFGFHPMLLLTAWWITVCLAWLAKVILLGLAVSRAANLMNDFFHDRLRTPNRTRL